MIPVLDSALGLSIKSLGGVHLQYSNIFTLNLPVSIPDEEKKLNFFIFLLLCGVSKGFMKAIKPFIKPFEASQRSAKTKI